MFGPVDQSLASCMLVHFGENERFIFHCSDYVYIFWHIYVYMIIPYFPIAYFRATSNALVMASTVVLSFPYM